VLGVGEFAPAFSLATADGGHFTEVDLRGAITVFVFYPFAFSPVCSDQLTVYEEVLGELHSRGARIYGVSCDSTWSQSAFSEKLGITIPQLSDFEPKGEVCRALGVLHEGGFPQRALIVFGPDAAVRWSYMADSPGDLPGVNVLFDGLEAATAS
jgi:peroxiredoxin